MADFQMYKDRKIEFLGLQQVRDWYVKVYTITLNDEFRAKETLNAAIDNLDTIFIKKAEASKLHVHKHAFIVVHEAREGVWNLFSWWTGGEMIETVVYFSSFSEPSVLMQSPHSGSLVCTWELEVFIHERQSWIKHILQKPKTPDFKSYQNDGLK